MRKITHYHRMIYYIGGTKLTTSRVGKQNVLNLCDIRNTDYVRIGRLIQLIVNFIDYIKSIYST